MTEIIQTGKNVQEALDAACRQLGLTVDEVEFEIISMPKKGFLGLMNTPAKVKVVAKNSVVKKAVSVSDTPPRSAKQKQEAPVNSGDRDRSGKAEAMEDQNDEAKTEAAVRYVQTILSEIGVTNAEITTSQEGNTVTLLLKGDGLGVIIGRRGETLDALQHLTGLVANRLEGSYLRVVINSGNFREKREKTLESLALNLARASIRTGKRTVLEPMNPYERRIIHAAVAKVEGARSSSIGEEPNRRVVISSKRSGGKPRGNDRRSNGPVGRGASRYERDDRRRPGNAPDGAQRVANRDVERPKESAQPVLRPESAAKVETEAPKTPLYSKIEIE